MERYERYKDSGVEWIGKIPDGWEEMKLKYLFRWEKGSNAATYTNEYVNGNRGDFPVFSGQTESEGILGFINTYDYDFNEEVLLVTTVGAKAMSIRKVSGKFSLSQNCALIIPKNNKSSSFYFFYYLQRLFAYEKTMISLIMQPSLRFEDLNQYTAYRLPSELQTAIANYLDRKTAEIDELIAQKERLIELYEEEKTAIINQAVTKGIDPVAKLKDSGVDWLGEIPEGWVVKRLKYAIESITGGGTPSTGIPEYWNGLIPWVSPKDMKVSKIMETEDYVTKLAIEQSSTNLIPIGRILIVVRSGILKHTLPVAINGVDLCLNQDMKAIKPTKDISNKFFYWKLKGLEKEILTICNKQGATVDSIEIDDLMDFAWTYPSHDDQTAIIHHIETETARINAKIAKTKRIIELQKEYRTALISEVVTGKIKAAA